MAADHLTWRFAAARIKGPIQFLLAAWKGEQSSDAIQYDLNRQTNLSWTVARKHSVRKSAQAVNMDKSKLKTFDDKLKDWQRTLLDLTDRNQLINFKQTTRGTRSIEIISPDAVQLFNQLLDSNSLLVRGTEPAPDEKPSLENLTLDGIQAPVTVESDASHVSKRSGASRNLTAITPLTPERTHRILLKMQKAARASLVEQGTNILFAGFGLLEWKSPERNSTETRKSPLLLLPIGIEESAREGGYRIAAVEDAPELNLTLAEKLAQEYGKQIPREWNFERDDALPRLFQEVRELIESEPEWILHERAFLGLFQFHKIRMYQDLSDHKVTAQEHEIIRALAFENMYLGISDQNGAGEHRLDNVVSPKDSYSVLDADSSQLLAIHSALKGQSFVLQGPPGTGKSQTIANIIAEYLARGKTVLFVSEKQAALEVVQRRLTAAGLGDLCLPLHSHKAERAEVIRALGARLEQVGKGESHRAVGQKIGERLSASRGALNDYAESLHEVRPPMNKSVFWAIGELSRLATVPRVVLPIGKVEALTEEKFHYLVEFAARAASCGDVLTLGDEHPWHGFLGETLSIQEQYTVQQIMVDVQEQSRNLLLNNISIANFLKIPAPSSISATERVIDFEAELPTDFSARRGWFEATNLKRSAEAIRQTSRQVADLEELKTWLLERFTPSFVNELPASDLLDGTLSQPFSPESRKFRSEMRAAYTYAPRLDEMTELETFEKATRVVELLEWFNDNREALSQECYISYEDQDHPGGDEVARTERNLQTTEYLKAHFLDLLQGGTIDALNDPDTLFESRKVIREQASLCHRLAQSWASLTSWFSPESGLVPQGALGEIGLLGIFAVATTLVENRDKLAEWQSGQLLLREATEKKLLPLVNAISPYPPDEWPDIVAKGILYEWLNRITQDTRLASFEHKSLEAATTEFCLLDLAVIESAPQRVKAELAALVPPIKEYGEPGMLKAELLKKRRHKPLRILFQDIPNLLPKLTPCLMMSPLSVAQYLPANKFQFDLILFDEASQVRPHDAVGAIMRGKQLIVAGDRHQLPPTAFFDYEMDSQSDENIDIADFESILDTLSVKGMQSHDMRWHYRSRNESLIAFSNRHIYGNSLVTFPSPEFGENTSSGVSFEFVTDGAYQEVLDPDTNATIKANRQEAKRVAELVLKHARHSPDKTLMVVTLGIQHRDVVEEEVNRVRGAHPELHEFFDESRLEPFTIKSLERVQGDERDVIIISVGFAKDAQGRLLHNFGPINRDGGERRINVLVTRARRQVIVVSSIRASDIDLTRSQRRGSRVFRDYLEFAEFGSTALPIAGAQEIQEYDSDFEESVAREIERLGYEVHTQIGCSGFRVDLAIVDPNRPGRYLLGIECDGATYHSAKTARDRDRLRQAVLEDLGWRIHRIWSTEWFRAKDKEVSRLLERIALELEGARVLPDREGSGVDLEFETSQVLEDLVDVDDESSDVLPVPDTWPYVEATITVPAGTELLWTPQPVIADAIEECVRQEWPIHHDLVTLRVARHWGNARTGNRIRDCVNQAIRLAIKQRRVVKKGEFLWVPDAGAVVVRGKSWDGHVRAIEHVAPEEIFAALRDVLLSGFSLPEQDLLRETARRLGYERTDKDVSTRLLNELKSATKEKLIVEAYGRYQLTDG